MKKRRRANPPLPRQYQAFEVLGDVLVDEHLVEAPRTVLVHPQHGGSPAKVSDLFLRKIGAFFAGDGAALVGWRKWREGGGGFAATGPLRSV